MRNLCRLNRRAPPFVRIYYYYCSPRYSLPSRIQSCVTWRTISSRAKSCVIYASNTRSVDLSICGSLALNTRRGGTRRVRERRLAHRIIKRKLGRGSQSSSPPDPWAPAYGGGRTPPARTKTDFRGALPPLGQIRETPRDDSIPFTDRSRAPPPPRLTIHTRTTRAVSQHRREIGPRESRENFPPKIFVLCQRDAKLENTGTLRIRTRRSPFARTSNEFIAKLTKDYLPTVRVSKECR